MTETALSKPASSRIGGVRIRGTLVLFWLCAAVVAVAVLVPSASLVWESLSKAMPDGSSVFSLDHYTRLLARPRTHTMLLTTLAFSSAITVVSVTVGLLFAWTAARTNTPFRGAIPILILLPYLIPPTMGAIIWTWLLTPRSGIINTLLAPLLGNSFFNIYSFAGMVFVESAYTVPLAFMFFYATLTSLNPTLEEASSVAGAGTLQTFLYTTLPNMWPAIISVATVMFIIGFESFDVAWFIGYPAKIYILGIELYTMTRVNFPADIAGASVYGVIALGIALVLVALYQRVTREQARFASITGKAYRHGVADIGRLRYLTCGLFLAFILIIGVLPLLMLLGVSFGMVSMPFALHPPRLDNFRWVFSDSQSLRAIRNTGLVAMLGSIALVSFGFLLAYVVTRSREKGRDLLEYLSFLPFATPSTVLAVAAVTILVWTPLYNTVWIVIVAFAVKFLPYALRNISNNILQIHPELEEASAVSGGNLVDTLRRVVLPLAAPGLVAAWSLLLIIFSRQFSLPMMLTSSGSQVITINVFNEWEGGQMGHVASYGILLIACCLPLLLLARVLGNRASSL